MVTLGRTPNPLDPISLRRIWIQTKPTTQVPWYGRTSDRARRSSKRRLNFWPKPNQKRPTATTGTTAGSFLPSTVSLCFSFGPLLLQRKTRAYSVSRASFAGLPAFLFLGLTPCLGFCQPLMFVANKLPEATPFVRATLSAGLDTRLAPRSLVILFYTILCSSPHRLALRP